MEYICETSQNIDIIKEIKNTEEEIIINRADFGNELNKQCLEIGRGLAQKLTSNTNIGYSQLIIQNSILLTLADEHELAITIRSSKNRKKWNVASKILQNTLTIPFSKFLINAC